MPSTIKIGFSQSHTLDTTAATLSALEQTTHQAAAKQIDILLFPEVYLGGYPRTCNFGAAVGSRTVEGRNQFLSYFKQAVDLGDTPPGAGDAWIERKLPLGADGRPRGDGTREALERIARQTGVFVVTGLLERSGGTLYCAAVYVCPRRGVVGKRRKVMPTGSERLCWGQGSPSTLRAVTAEIRGVRVVMAAAICWENYMPLLRYSLYSQNVNLWLAPTADPRPTWAPLMQTVAMEGRCFVVSANQCQRRGDLPAWITGRESKGRGKKEGEEEQEQEEEVEKKEMANGTAPTTAEGGGGQNGAGPAVAGRRTSMSARTAHDHEIVWRPKDASGGVVADHASPSASAPAPSDDDEFLSRGGSCIVGPLGDILAGPLWEVPSGDGTLVWAEVDLDDCERGRLDFDAAGSYSRNDAFKMTVEGLDISPPV